MGVGVGVDVGAEDPGAGSRGEAEARVVRGKKEGTPGTKG